MKKSKTQKEIEAALKKGGLSGKVHKLTAREEKLAAAREVEREQLNKPIKQPAPSYVKRKAEAKAKYKPLEKKLQDALAKFGGAGAKVATFHSEYYTARGAQALLELQANPKQHHEKTTIRKKLKFFNLKNGRYLIERDGKADFKTYKWKTVEAMQRKQNREIKIERIAARIGANVSDVKKIIKSIEAEERRNVRAFKKTAKYKTAKHKKNITIKRRVAAVFGAMTDLLEIYGSPKALREDAAEANWKKINGKWCVKSGGKWHEKIGPGEYTRMKVRKSKKKKGKKK